MNTHVFLPLLWHNWSCSLEIAAFASWNKGRHEFDVIKCNVILQTAVSDHFRNTVATLHISNGDSFVNARLGKSW